MLWLPEAEAMRTIDNTIRWHRAINQNPHWTPTVTEIPDLNFDEILCRATLDDSTFRRLFLRHLGNLPVMFLSHVRSSIQALLLPPLPNTVQPYPRMRTVSNITSLSTVDVDWLRQKLEWNPRWGFDHWHGIYHDSSGRTVSLFHFSIDRNYSPLLGILVP